MHGKEIELLNIKTIEQLKQKASITKKYQDSLEKCKAQILELNDLLKQQAKFLNKEIDLSSLSEKREKLSTQRKNINEQRKELEKNTNNNTDLEKEILFLTAMDACAEKEKECLEEEIKLLDEETTLLRTYAGVKACTKAPLKNLSEIDIEALKGMEEQLGHVVKEMTEKCEQQFGKETTARVLEAIQKSLSSTITINPNLTIAENAQNASDEFESVMNNFMGDFFKIALDTLPPDQKEALKDLPKEFYQTKMVLFPTPDQMEELQKYSEEQQKKFQEYMEKKQKK